MNAEEVYHMVFCRFLETDSLSESNRKAGVLAGAEEKIKLQKAIYDYAYKLKIKHPKMTDARIRRKTEEYFKRSMKS
jgi:hypothetical protein